MDPDLSLNAELLQANRFDLVSRLADDLAHEIKNPLNAIIINLEVLKVRVTRDQPAEALERAAVIEHETRRLHGLVDRLLQLLRPHREETGSLALDQLLDELLPLIEAQAKLARNQFVADAEATVFISVRRDAFKFGMLNVLTAVHERLGEGGGTLKVLCRSENGHVRLQVEALPDEGGLAPAGEGYRRAIEMATILFAGSGGVVEELENGIGITLPRTAAA